MKTNKSVKQKTAKLGDCYEKHAKMMLDFNDQLNAVICHGTVYHPETGWHGHCWLELGDDVVMDLSNGHSYLGRREVYYEIGRVKDVKRYTLEQLRINLLKYKTYGDWNDDK